MPGIPGDHELSKGIILQRIDAALNDEAGDFKKRSDLLAALEDWIAYPSLPDILVDKDVAGGALPTVDEAQPLFDFWFGGTPLHPATNGTRRGWPDIQPIEPVMRQGLIQAIKLANFDTEVAFKPEHQQDPGLPKLWIDSYWICARHFEMVLTRSAKQVNWLIFTPDAPVNTPTSYDDPSRDIVFVRQGSAAESKISVETRRTGNIDSVVEVIQVRHP